MVQASLGIWTYSQLFIGEVVWSLCVVCLPKWLVERSLEWLCIASDGPVAFSRFCHCLWSFCHRLRIQKWLVNFPFPCRCQHMCLISGIDAKTSRLEFSSLLEIKGSPQHHMGFSVLLLNKANPVPPRANGKVPKRGGGGRNSQISKYCTPWGRWV